MSTAVDTLFDRAERAGAALMIFDDQERIIKVNNKQAKVYDFADYAKQPTFKQFQKRFIKSTRIADPAIQNDPNKWINASAHFRRISDYAQFITRHSNGQVLLVCHERIRGATNWCYQARIDITQELKARFKTGNELLGPASWDGSFAPLARHTTVPIGNILDAMPTAAGLILAQGKLIDANRRLLTILDNGDGLRTVEDRVTTGEVSEQAEFQHRLERFFQGDGARSPVAMRISRLNYREPYFVTITPLLDPEREAWDNGHIGVLTVADPAAPPNIDPHLLKEFFDITLAEAEVAAALGAGHTIALIAKQRMVQTNTIYAQIKKIIEKTGHRNHADIARRVSDLARIFGR